mmetsp:Transcript_19496/g.56703  ORF Transcript_19496/g.56703 Transcript_19496/m.56703 type:complete len:105 (+) Transcript_19496:1255-1569(+)
MSCPAVARRRCSSAARRKTVSPRASHAQMAQMAQLALRILWGALSLAALLRGVAANRGVTVRELPQKQRRRRSHPRGSRSKTCSAAWRYHVANEFEVKEYCCER